MPDLDPTVLKRLREFRGLTQDELQARSQINKQTISNLERGARRNVRRRTVQLLSQALGVSEGALSGQDPVTDGMPFDRRSQLTLRIDDGARNALSLVCRRFHLTAGQVVEIAPLLLFWAAESSLAQRRELLEEYERRLAEAGAMQGQFAHLSSFLSYFPNADDIVAAEKTSIDRRDVFAARMYDDSNEMIVPSEFDEEFEGPLPVFLKDRAAEVGVVFEGWSSVGSPTYELCREEAAEIVGGDQELAARVLSGAVALHRMPAEVVKAGAEARRQWAREESDRVAEEAKAFFKDLDLDPNFLDGSSE